MPAAQPAPTPAAPELGTVRIGTVAINDFIELPLALAQQLGYFSATGLDVHLVDYPGAPAALADLAAGKLDLVSVPYENTIRSQATGSTLKMVALYDLRPGLVLSVAALHASSVRSMKDLAGKTLCLNSRGSATEAFVDWLAARDGVDPASFVYDICGIAPERYAAGFASGAVWAAVQVDPPFTRLQRQGVARALYETRSEQGAKQVYGGHGVYPTNGLIAPQHFVRSYPNTVSALVRGVVKGLRYIHTHSGSQTAAELPASFKEGDPALYASSLNANLGMFSSDGLVPSDGPPAVLRVLQLVFPAVTGASIDLGQTYDNSFARAAAGSIGPGT